MSSSLGTSSLLTATCTFATPGGVVGSVLLFCFGGDGGVDLDGAAFFGAFSSRGVFGGVNDVTLEEVDDDDADDGGVVDGGNGAGPFSFLIT